MDHNALLRLLNSRRKKVKPSLAGQLHIWVLRHDREVGVTLIPDHQAILSPALEILLSGFVPVLPRVLKAMLAEMCAQDIHPVTADAFGLAGPIEYSKYEVTGGLVYLRGR